MFLLLCNGQICATSKICRKYRNIQARHLFICVQTTAAALSCFEDFCKIVTTDFSVLSAPSSACGPAWACQEKKSGCLHKPVKNWMQHKRYCSQLHKNIAVQYGNESQSMLFTYSLGINTNPLRIRWWTLSTLSSTQLLWSNAWYLLGLMLPMVAAQT